MAGGSAGQIGLDLVLNSKGFEQAVTNVAKKGATILAAAFSVKKIVDFSKECMAAAEVQEAAELKLQTVMRQRMKATDSAVQSIKDFTAEQQNIGVVGDEVQMSGAQQLATFLNTSDALKTLIPAMNNLAVQQNGVNVSAESMVNIGNLMGKVMQGQTSALSRVGITFSAAQEKMLKYGTEQQKAATLAQVITDNVGEMNKAFAQTPTGQIQQIKNNFGDTLEVIGMGLQNFLMPFLSVINTLVARMATLANSFKAFSELITGNKAEKGMSATNTAAGTAQESLDNASDSAGDLADNTEQAGKKAKKAAKEMRALMGFDKINKLSSPITSEESKKDTPATSTAGSPVDYGNLAEGTKEADKLSKALDPLIERGKELDRLFQKGFRIGFGDSEKKIDSIKNHLGGIKTSLEDIVRDKTVVSSFNRMLDSMAIYAGKRAGSMASIGLTVMDNLVGGIDKYLAQNKEYIKKNIASIFDVTADILDIGGDAEVAIANVLSVFRGENAKQCTASIIGIFSDGFLGALNLALKFVRDIGDVLTGWFIDNQEVIKNSIDNTLAPISIALDTLHTSVQDTFVKIHAVYDEHIAPFLKELRDGLSELTKELLDGYNKYVAPVLKNLAEKFDGVWKEHIQPAIDGILDVLGELFDFLGELWVKGFQPVISWLIQYAMPIIGKFCKFIGDNALDNLSDIADVVKAITKVLSGLIQFITGVFNGDWKKAWNGIKKIFGGVFDAMAALIRKPVNIIVSGVEKMVNGVIRAINGMIRALNNLSFSIPDWVPYLGGASFGLNIPSINELSIPRLAQGGYVQKNTPRLAMIGDNRHEGEIVAPESKMKAMALEAARAVSGGGISRDELESVINRATMRIIAALANLGFNIDGQLIARAQKMAQTAIDMQYNTVTID